MTDKLSEAVRQDAASSSGRAMPSSQCAISDSTSPASSESTGESAGEFTGRTIVREFYAGSRKIRLELPADPDRMLLDAVEGEASGDRHTDPYWGLLWEAAPRTAEGLLRHTWPRGGSALELGCGVGLVGIAGLCAGLNLTFSDRVPAAVSLAVRNAHNSGFDNAAGLVLDWYDPPDLRFDVLLASDVLYDAANHEPLLNVCERLLSPGGLAWFGDAGRHHTPRFIELARDRGWQIQLQDESCRVHLQPKHMRFQIIVLRREPSA